MNKKEIREKAIRQIFEETALQENGFRCTKKSIYKKVGDFKLSLNFGSAISPNRLEEVNYLEVRASVSHEGLRKYKKENFKQNNGYIGGAAIANLFKAGPPWISYDLGIRENTYNEKLSQIKQVIEKDVFHFYDEFTDINKINNYIWKPCFNLRCSIHLYVFLSEKDLLDEVIGKASIDRKESFKHDYVNFNRRLNSGETWIEVYKDVKDGEDSLSLEIANSLYEMGINL
ncbi:hypothetical protein [Portibacter lacus]|uniref:Uncharacterized protein n=1 Tax=Portibacter lacus TaxID=1099794 RepID=A0AA37WGE6_9BACT|nr:hypothetical protein [Portibacter lacus]GLR19722.1 hypothetical protein GCM10007940_43380 [Portibacter lacus]